MPAKVFISCGQRTEEEKAIVCQVASLLRDLGFEPYVAISVQTIPDLNKGIVDELKSSDVYLLLNFRREELGEGDYRGSLFSNQELAMAYALGFDKILILNEAGVRPEGLAGSLVVNTPALVSRDNVPARLREAIEAARWDPTYSRQLAAVSLEWTRDYVTYGDGREHFHVRILYVDVRNGRNDVGAVGTVARLSSIRTASGVDLRVTDSSPLKATGQPGYEQTILPGGRARFDLFGVENPETHTGPGPRVFLQSALDLVPRRPILHEPGRYSLRFEVFAQGYPKLEFTVELRLSPDPLDSTAALVHV